MKKILLLLTLTLIGVSQLQGMHEDMNEPSYQSLPNELKQEIMNTVLATSNNLYEAAKSIKQLSVLHNIRYDSFKDVLEFVKVLQNKFPNKSNEEINLALEKQGLLMGLPSLPKDVQQEIKNIMLHDAINFLGMQPIFTLYGHASIVYSVAINGDRLATASYDKTAKIWDIHTGQLLHTVEEHTGLVYSETISGDKIIAKSNNDTPKRQNTHTSLLRILQEHDNKTILALAINDDKVVIGIAYDNTAKIFDLNTGQLLHTLQGHTGLVTAIAINGDRVVTGSTDNTAKIWDINTGQLLHTLQGHTSSIHSIAISDDKVVTGSFDNTAKIWPLQPNFKGTTEDNPLLWIRDKATMPQQDFIIRVYQATSARHVSIIHFSSEDTKVMLGFPEHVRQYLLARLKIYFFG